MIDDRQQNFLRAIISAAVASCEYFFASRSILS